MLFCGVHQPIQLVGCVADFTQARLALCAATVLHWLALIAVGFGLMWMQPSVLRSHLVSLCLFLAAQWLLFVAAKLLRNDAQVPLNPRILAGRLAAIIAFCGALLIIPGLILAAEIVVKDAQIHF